MTTETPLPAAGRPRTSLLGGEVVRRGLLGRGLTGGTVAVLVTLVAASSLLDLFVVRALPALLAEIAVIGLVWWGLTKRAADGVRSWAEEQLEARVFAWTQARTGGWWTPAWAPRPAAASGPVASEPLRRRTVAGAVVLLVVAVLSGFSPVLLAVELAAVAGWFAVRRRRAGRSFGPGMAAAGAPAGLIPAQPTGGPGEGWSMPPEVGRVSVAAVAPPSRPQAPIAVLRHRDEPSGEFYSVALEIAGGGDGLRDVAEANRAGRRLGRFLYSLSTPAFLTDEVQLLTRTVPIDPARYDAWLAERLAPDCPPLLAASMRALADDVGYSAEQHRSFLVLRVPYAAVVDRYRTQTDGAGSGSPEMREQARLAVLADEVRAAGGLANRCGLRVRHVLGPARLAALIRSTYQPDVGLDELTGASLGTCWPAYRNLAGRLEVGDWSHAVASVPRDGYPMGPVGLRMLEPLVAGLPGVVRTVSVGLRLLPRAVARRQARADHTLDLADATTERRRGRTSDGTSEAQSASSAQRLHDLMFDEAAGTRPAVRLLISARSPGQLSVARDAADTAAADAGFLRLDWHERRSSHAMLLACPLARGIRR